MGLGLRIVLIVLVGAVGAAAARLGPSWVDHRHNPHVALSARVVNFGPVQLNTSVEHLLTVRNGGHYSVVNKGGGGVLRNFNSVCPRRLGAVKRMTSCGLSVSTAAECDRLAAGVSCAVAVHFTPRTTKPYSARFCFRYAATAQDWRQTETCLTVTGRGSRGGKGVSAR